MVSFINDPRWGLFVGAFSASVGRNNRRAFAPYVHPIDTLTMPKLTIAAPGLF
jgi:hypothetical protein